MRPITHHIPKPLLPIIDRTLIDIHIKDLKQHDVASIGINLYHKADIIRSYIEKYDDKSIVVAIEPALLGTGGALRNFPQFEGDELLVMSCDVISDWNMRDVFAFHRSHNGCATLVLSSESRNKIVEIDKDNHVVHIGSTGRSRGSYDFTGTAIYSKEILSCLPDDKAFSFVDLITHIQKQGEEVYGYATDMGWYNINTCDALLQIHEEILSNHVTVKGICVDGSIYVDPSSEVQTNSLDGFIAIGAHCTIGSDVDLHNTIVVAGSTIVHGTYRNCIVSDDFCIQVDNKDV